MGHGASLHFFHTIVVCCVDQLNSQGLADITTTTVEDTIVGISANTSALNTLTGQKSFDTISNYVISAKGFTDNTINSVSGSFAVDFDTGILSNGRVFVCVGAGVCSNAASYGETFWPVVFQGSLAGNSLTSRISTTGTLPTGLAAAVSADSVGHFLGAGGEGFVLTFSSSRGTGADASTATGNSIISPDRFVNGAVLFGGNSQATTVPVNTGGTAGAGGTGGASVTVGTGGTSVTVGIGGATVITSPPLDSEIGEPDARDHGVDWGQWDNPLASNWGVAIAGDESGARVSSGEFFADAIPTQLANMQGSASYASTDQSAFIGSGSAGQLTDVVASMGVDFDTGAITDGSLMVEVAGSQTWDIGFAGSISGGAVDLNMTSGQLFNFSEIISSSIDADLGGIFTGDYAEAFVGGFDLVDQIDSLNQVNGIYTIER
jgi:hypothetical protein